MLELVVIVCLVAIVGFFSQEFRSIFKRIFELKGMTLLLPLALGSWFVFSYDVLVLEALLYIRDKLNVMNNCLIETLPHNQYIADVILIFLLTLVSVGPVYLLNFLSFRRTNQPFAHPYLVSTLTWIISATLLVSLPALYYS
jgi:hypothetical protein